LRVGRVRSVAADVRGSTGLAARAGPTEFPALMQRFFRVAIKVFTKTHAVAERWWATR
jgi:class 3 adenylate cyclase